MHVQKMTFMPKFRAADTEEITLTFAENCDSIGPRHSVNKRITDGVTPRECMYLVRVMYRRSYERRYPAAYASRKWHPQLKKLPLTHTTSHWLNLEHSL